MVVVVAAAAVAEAVALGELGGPKERACSWSWQRNPCPWVFLPEVQQEALVQERAVGAAETLVPVPVLPLRRTKTCQVEDSY